MRKPLRVVLISLLIFIVDFVTLENRLVTTSSTLQLVGGLVAVLAVAGIVWGLILMVKTGRPGRLLTPRIRPVPATPAEKTAEPPRRRSRFRPLKVLMGLAILGSWFIVLPILVHKNLIAPAADYVPGPWVAEAFLSLFALALQCFAPTPVALVFWPSLGVGLYFLFSRKDRPVLDPLLGIAAAVLVFVLFRFVAPL